MKTQYQIIIIGGGTAGIMTASQLKSKNPSLEIVIIDPAEKHYYQPAFTLVGAGTYNMEKTFKPMKEMIPSGVEWIQDHVTALKPDQNQIVLSKEQKVLQYEYLIVAPGLMYDYSLIEGLEEALDRGVVCSNYIDPEYTWKCLQEFKGGTALFTQPTTPIKCGGAPQKIMYLASHYFQKKGIDKKSKVIFATPGTVIFGVKEIAETLLEVVNRYHIDVKLHHAPYKIDADKKIAYFKNKNTKEGEENTMEIPFDLLHLAPPQTAPKFIKESLLANVDGWVDVDRHSMQHNKYPNVFSLGDASSLPVAKTGAAIRKQAPIVVDNLLKLIQQKPADNRSYNGYSSCPLVTGYGKMVLAEFNYKNEFTPDPKLKGMLVFNSHKEHWRLWILKKYILPYLYWNKMMKGKDV